MMTTMMSSSTDPIAKLVAKIKAFRVGRPIVFFSPTDVGSKTECCPWTLRVPQMPGGQLIVRCLLGLGHPIRHFSFVDEINSTVSGAMVHRHRLNIRCSTGGMSALARAAIGFAKPCGARGYRRRRKRARRSLPGGWL
jgi:hypothetical protein